MKCAGTKERGQGPLEPSSCEVPLCLLTPSKTCLYHLAPLEHVLDPTTAMSDQEGQGPNPLNLRVGQNHCTLGSAH